MRNILISTVGTSLLSNIHRLDENYPLTKTITQGNLIATALELLKLSPEHRTCGAEINSITSMLKKGKLEKRHRLIFLLSDTDDGRSIGKILKHYYDNRGNQYSFEEVSTTVVEGLRDDDVKSFRNEGLRNLVRSIGKLVRQYGSQFIAINATGGYKAQISFAGLIGQALQIPVYYLFEKFSEVIELPPQPVSLDFTFWLKHYDLFRMLDLEDVLKDKIGMDIEDPNFQTLIREVKIDGEMLVGLSAMGQLFHEQFKYRFAQEKERLLPAYANLPLDEKDIKYEDKNDGKHQGLASYLSRILKTPYVKRIYTFYYNPDLPQKNHFQPSTRGDFSQVTGTYSDGKATTKFGLVTTARNQEEQQAAVIDLNERFVSG